MADKRASSSSLLTKEVVFSTENDKLVVNEKWYIQDDNNILLIAEGPSFRFISLHRDGKRYRLNEAGQVLSSDDDTNFFQSFFVNSDPNSLAKYLVSLNVASPDILKKEEPVFKLEDIKLESSDSVRLTRLNGVVNYGIGTPMPANSNSPTPQVWVVQDLFHVSKLRGEDFVVEASKFEKHRRGFWYPQKMSVKWGELGIEASTLKLVGINIGPNTKKKFSFDYLKSNKPIFATEENATLQKIQSFYLKFR